MDVPKLNVAFNARQCLQRETAVCVVTEQQERSPVGSNQATKKPTATKTVGALS